MRHASYKSVEDRVLALAGIKPADRSTDLRGRLNGYINTAVKLAWEFYWWPELMRSELRYYRDDYAAGTTYAAGDEVYYPTTALYYTALGATTGNAPTNATYWEPATELDAYIELEQTGQTAIGEVRGVFHHNPLTTRQPRRIEVMMGPHGLHLLGESLPPSAWVFYRQRPNEYTGDDYSATATYAAGAAIYYAGSTSAYEGDYWTCLSATSVAESPESTPAKWSRIEFPRWLKEAVCAQAHHEYLITDGAPVDIRDRAAATAGSYLQQAVHLYAGQQRQSLGRVA